MFKMWQKELLDAAKEQNLILLKEIFMNLDDSNKQFTTEEGKNLLHFVSDKKSENTLPMIQFLLEEGINPEALDQNFNSPLDIAKNNSNVPAMALMKYFINKKNQELENY